MKNKIKRERLINEVKIHASPHKEDTCICTQIYGKCKYRQNVIGTKAKEIKIGLFLFLQDAIIHQRALVLAAACEQQIMEKKNV